MKYWVALLLLFGVADVAAQDHEAEVSFIRAISHTYIDSAAPYYYLEDTARNLFFNWNEWVPKMSPYLDKNDALEMLRHADQDTAALLWSSISLPKAICISHDSAMSRFESKPFLSTVNSNWSKKRKKREADKQIQQQEMERAALAAKTRWCDKVIYYFNKPVFDKTCTYAILGAGRYCGMMCGGHEVSIFKNSNGTWKRITMVSSIAY